MHDVVVDALGRIEAAEEAATFDREIKRRGRCPNPPWAIDSAILGHVQQSDIPKLLMDEIAKASLIKGGVTALAREINLVSTKVLNDYACNKYKMGYSTGRLFVRYLEERAKTSGAAPAATGTTPESKATTSEAPAPIVPQPVQEEKTTDLQARIAEIEAQNAELKTALDTATAKLASVQGREMSELEAEVETLRRRVAHYEADDEACGPARVEELEDRLSRANDEHVRDLELIRDLTRQLVVRSAC